MTGKAWTMNREMNMNSKKPAIRILASVFAAAWLCAGALQADDEGEYASKRLGIYVPVTLTADVGHLSDNQKRMLRKLIEASVIMDDLFWQQVYGDKDALLSSIDDKKTRRFAEINYGPWDLLAGGKVFVEGQEPRRPGANFYPADMSKEEFEAWDQPRKTNQYSVVRRDEHGKLFLIPYHELFAPQLEQAAALLREASELAEHEGFANYLRLRADALLSGDYQSSDMAWMDVKGNPIDLVYGPIESYQDGLFGYRNAFESFVLIKDMAWSEKLARFAQFLPRLQEGLPVDAAYKAESPGSNADLNAYDAAYVAGDANAGAKTIAINLPNDEVVQLAKGTRRLQLKNNMRAKFDKILLPISEILIAEDQRSYVTFDAFFENTMFHEVAHGLGIKNTLDGKGTVREALLEHASALEEGKADILGLYMLTELHAAGEMPGRELKENYVTFMAGIFRSVRFGAGSAHGRANMIRFSFFREKGAFSRDAETGYYSVDFDSMREAMTDLSRLILTLQGDGDYEGVTKLVAERGSIGPELQADLDRLSQASIPVDIVFRQGTDVLGL
ncbi:MAG: Zn-dependent hydrolase [Gammaproteobacteria bacterium]|nr:MAG: Zn-dependent hydrolase [Gammaproteobacteria bacterium]